MRFPNYPRNNKLLLIAAQWISTGVGLASITIFCHRLHVNLATSSLLCLILIVLLSRTGNAAASIVASIMATVCLTYLAPPENTFAVDDPFDIVAIAAFLITSLVIAQLVSKLRNMAEDALSSVNRKLVDAEQRERNRIARDLHDDLGQRFALLAGELQQIQKEIPNSGCELHTSFASIHHQIAAISNDLHTISHELHSSNLEYLGVVATMRGFCRELAQQQKVQVDFKSKDLTLPLSPDTSMCLFRVLQEALHNSAKHSRASHFKVELFPTSEAVHLIVHDSGIGFDPKTAIRGRGLGLTSMKERMKLVRGNFSINSQPGTGTTIHVWAPLSNQRSDTYPETKVS